MRAELLWTCAEQRALELPGSALAHPFGHDWDVYKVRDRMFMLLTVLGEEPIVILKSRPEDAKLLCEVHDDIAPGYHMNKRHWITLRPGGALDRGMVADLVTESYLLVLEAGVPRSQWPVDPTTFGRGSAVGDRGPAAGDLGPAAGDLGRAAGDLGRAAGDLSRAGGDLGPAALGCEPSPSAVSRLSADRHND